MNSSTSTSEPQPQPRPRAGLRFLAWLVISAALGAGVASLASAFGSADLVPQLAFVLRGRATVVLFGNSMNRTRSHCDRDTRDLAAMLQAELGEPVRDVSSGGMHSSEHVAQARALVARRAARTIILPLIPGSIEEPSASDETDRIRVAAYSAIARARPAEVLAALRPPADASALALDERALDPEGFGARRDALMQAEKNAEACPETQAKSRAFMRFMYRKRVAGLPSAVVLPDAVRALAREARAAGVELLLYAPPFATGLLVAEGMKAELAQEEAYAASLARAARSLPARFVDLHAALPADAFTDAWCACGHLREQGRAAVARALAKSLISARSLAEASAAGHVQ